MGRILYEFFFCPSLQINQCINKANYKGLPYKMYLQELASAENSSNIDLDVDTAPPCQRIRLKFQSHFNNKYIECQYFCLF